eukprot:g659.t1
MCSSVSSQSWSSCLATNSNTCDINYWNYPFYSYCVHPAEVSEDNTIEKVKDEIQELLILDELNSELPRRISVLLQSSRDVENLQIAFLISMLGCRLNGLDLHIQAEQLHRRALCIGIKALGQDHPDLANSMEWLAFSLYKQSNFKEAVLLCYSTIVLVHESVGQFHPKTAHCYYNLAMIVEAMGLFDHAQVLREKGSTLLAVLYPHLHHYWWNSFRGDKDLDFSQQSTGKQDNWNYQGTVFYPPTMMFPCHENFSIQQQQTADWMLSTSGLVEDNNLLYSYSGSSQYSHVLTPPVCI